MTLRRKSGGGSEREGTKNPVVNRKQNDKPVGKMK